MPAPREPRLNASVLPLAISCGASALARVILAQSRDGWENAATPRRHRRDPKKGNTTYTSASMSNACSLELATFALAYSPTRFSKKFVLPVRLTNSMKSKGFCAL